MSWLNTVWRDALLNDLTLVHFQSLYKVVLFWLVEYSSPEKDVVISHVFLQRPQPTEAHTAWPTLILKQFFFHSGRKDGTCQFIKLFLYLIWMAGKSIIIPLFYQDQCTLSKWRSSVKDYMQLLRQCNHFIYIIYKSLFALIISLSKVITYHS